MATKATPYRFGDVLALARRSWILAMDSGLEAKGYRDYRVSDAASMRLLLAGQLTLGRLAATLGVTRQAARKVVRGLEQRGLAAIRTDPADARRLDVVPTEAGARYADAVIEVIESLNRQLAERVHEEALADADVVLRAAITESGLRRTAARIPRAGRRRPTPIEPG